MIRHSLSLNNVTLLRKRTLNSRIKSYEGVTLVTDVCRLDFDPYSTMILIGCSFRVRNNRVRSPFENRATSVVLNLVPDYSSYFLEAVHLSSLTLLTSPRKKEQ